MNESNDYIDIHTHILPGVDDGSGSMEETIKMLQIAFDQDIRTIIATPHYIAGSKNASVEQLNMVRSQVQEEAEKLDKEFKILLGNELYYSEAIMDDLKSQKALTLADSRYILVEFSVRDTYERIYKGMKELIYAGYAPVLAHVERYHCLYKKPELISELIRLGCYIQMNSDSLTGGIFNSEANVNRKLLNNGLVHLVGSDCHRSEIRKPKMKDTVKILQKKCDENLIHKIFLENPANILKNTYI